MPVATEPGEPGPVPVAQPPLTSPAQSPSVSIVNTDMFGPILVDSEGFTLYTFVVDEPGMTTCYGSCVNAWPPAIIEGTPVAPGIGLPGRLGTVQRDDGTTQLAYNDWPLYRFSRDQAPGQIAGDGSVNSGGLWPVATTGAVKATASINDPHVGNLVDADGMTLYTWAGDEAGMSMCNEGCSTAWPPLLVDGKLIVGAGLSRVLGTITRDDGTTQVTLREMPLYRFSRDATPGEANGVGSTGFGAAWSVASLETAP